MKLSELSARQIARAEVIYRAALPFGRDAVKAALMTAAAESSFLLYANDGSTKRTDVPQKWRDLAATSLQFEHDAVAPKAQGKPAGTWDTTADSVGHFQQRPMYDYGSIAELMDPAESTRIFIRGSHGGAGRTRRFLDSPKDMDLARRCQWTQGSEFPTGENYRPMEQVADQLIERFGPMTDGYKDADAWADGSKIPWGSADYDNPDPNKIDTLRKSWWGTNRAAYAVWDIARGLPSKVDGLVSSVAGIATELVRIRTYVARIEKKVDALAERDKPTP